ncbi:LacI family DNA-binding transcriptional regulator [Trueperella pyogenes]|uniref:LacI family DNA-binding transcriptional regulator n=1 Tax=Trueperella pyogenes TaxID=1661 RepID=UPI00345CD34E
MKLQVTMEMVAQDAGVSRATVSRVFSHPDSVHRSTCNRVFESANKLGYVRNEAATRLARKSSDIVGLLLRETVNPAYAALHDTLLAETTKLGLLVATMSAGDYYHDRGEYARVSKLLTLRPAGMFIASGLIDPSELAPIAEQLPVIVLGRLLSNVQLAGTQLHNIAYDPVNDSKLVAQALYEAGHRKVILCQTTAECSATENLRALTMERYINELGGDACVIDDQDLMNAPDRLFEAILDLSTRHGASAVMFTNDMRALRFMTIAKRRGVKIPDDIGVSGCDGIGQATELSGLLSVRLPIERVCQVATDYMQRFIRSEDAPSAPVQEVFAGTLIGGDTI